MSATTFDEIYDLEKPVETAFKSLLADADLAAYATADFLKVSEGSGDTFPEFQKHRPRVEINFTVSGETGHWGRTNGPMRKDCWSGLLTLTIVSDANETTHLAYRNRVRSVTALAGTTLAGDADLLPYHTLAEITDTGLSATIAPQDGYFTSQLTFSMFIYVRPDAWPSE